MSFLINPFLQYGNAAPAISYLNTSRPAGNPGSSFTFVSAVKTKNQFRFYVVAWESVDTDVSLTSLTWGSETMTIIQQLNITQGSSRGGLALCKIIPTESAASQPISVVFSNNVAAASMSWFNVVRNTSDTQYYLATSTKAAGPSSLFINNNVGARSCSLVAQINITGGATSTYSSTPSFTKSFDLSAPSASPSFQISAAIYNNTTATDFGDISVEIVSNTSVAGAISTTIR